MTKKITISLLLSGIGIGWMAGLAVSPVVQNLITSLVTLALAAVGILAGIEKTDKAETDNVAKPRSGKVNVMPIALITCGVAVGTALGIYSRAHNLLGVELTREQQQTMTDVQKQASGTILFGASEEYCQEICLQEGDALRASMKLQDDPALNALIDSLRDNQLLALKGYLCPRCK